MTNMFGMGLHQAGQRYRQPLDTHGRGDSIAASTSVPAGLHTAETAQELEALSLEQIQELAQTVAEVFRQHDGDAMRRIYATAPDFFAEENLFDTARWLTSKVGTDPLGTETFYENTLSMFQTYIKEGAGKNISKPPKAYLELDSGANNSNWAFIGVVDRHPNHAPEIFGQILQTMNKDPRQRSQLHALSQEFSQS
jgi:hypothetical protein